MNQLIIKKLHAASLEVNNLSHLMDKENIEFHSINHVNWSSFPYQPTVKFRMAYSDKGILLNYHVEEEAVRAHYGNDNGSVWTDSCVEFFIIPANDEIYYNVETNCAGTVLIGAGATRNNREHAPLETLAQIQRWSSLGREPFEVREGKCNWELSLIIPYSSFFKHSIDSLEGTTVKANLYKCGDELPTPHFLSWNRIEIEKPDFHRPDYFGEISFK